MQGPRIQKVIVSSGIGKKRDKKQLELIEDRLAKITGQKQRRAARRFLSPHSKCAKATPVGLQITLRGARMYDFLDKLIHIALPRTRDFPWAFRQSD